jgi:trk system potassium uptake protein TrkH
MSLTDAFFESVSGITTSGGTVIVGLNDISRGLLLWRSLMAMIGGVGIIAFVIILLPLLNIGGMQLFHTESSDQSDKALPRTGALMRSLLVTYFGLTAACALSYYIFGMNGFDAITHSFATISTAGFANYDDSYGSFPPMVQNTATIFMLMGALPFLLFVRMANNNEFLFHRDPQVKALLLIIAFAIAILTAYAVANTDLDVLTALRHSAFNVVSIITTTGFSSTDYLLWGPFAVIAFFFITYLGGCAGSTSGGIKMMRIVVATKALGAQFKRLIFPHGVFVITYDGRTVPTRTVYGVLGFLFVYVSANTVLTIALSLTGLDFATAIGAAAAAIANVGPGITPQIGPVGNYADIPDAAKWMLSFGMLIGRLEIMTVLVLFTPAFWRK